MPSSASSETVLSWHSFQCWFLNASLVWIRIPNSPLEHLRLLKVAVWSCVSGLSLLTQGTTKNHCTYSTSPAVSLVVYQEIDMFLFGDTESLKKYKCSHVMKREVKTWNYDRRVTNWMQCIITVTCGGKKKRELPGKRQQNVFPQLGFM